MIIYLKNKESKRSDVSVYSIITHGVSVVDRWNCAHNNIYFIKLISLGKKISVGGGLISHRFYCL